MDLLVYGHFSVKMMKFSGYCSSFKGVKGVQKRKHSLAFRILPRAIQDIQSAWAERAPETIIIQGCGGVLFWIATASKINFCLTLFAEILKNF